MEIIEYRKNSNTGALFIHMNGTFTACTAVESSRVFKTLKGAIQWLTKRGYKELK